MEDPFELYPAKDDGVEIQVTVSNPFEKKSGLSTYTVYTIKGADREGQFSSEKRYSDFDILRNLLLLRWPGCFIPPLPKKKVIGNSDAVFIEFRRKGLEIFCQETSKLKHLWYSKQYQTFIRSTSGDLEKQLKNLPQQSYEDIIKKYDEQFPKLSGKDIDTTTLARVLEFINYSKRTIPILENFKEMAASFLESKNSNFEQFGLLFNYVLPEYEKSCLAVYCNQITEGKFIFNESNDEKLTSLIAKLKEKIQQKQFEELYQALELQERQLEAFIEVYKTREHYEQKLKDSKSKEKDLELEQLKLNAGKQNVFKSLMKGNIEQSKAKVVKDLENTREEMRLYSFLCDLITLLMGYFEIPRFRQDKLELYYENIKKIAQFQLEFTTIRAEIHTHVLENHNLM